MSEKQLAPNFCISAQPIREKEQKTHLHSLYALIGCIGLATTLLMVYGFYLSNHLVVKYAPLVDAAMEIKLEATTAHLWFEEIISGDKNEDINVVRHHLREAQWYAQAMLKGGKNTEGIFVPLDDDVLRAEIENVSEKITTFQKVTEQRFNAIVEAKSGTPIDQRYDIIFRDFVNQADRVESKLQDKLSEKAERYQAVEFFLILTSLVCTAAILYVVHRYETRRSLDMRKIDRTNRELQKALKEIKTLQGIIPICGYCKKIRDEEGLWNQLEHYIHNHSDAQFSHGVCPDCYDKQMTKLKSKEIG